MDSKLLIEKIKATREDANLNLDLVDPRLHSGFEGRKRSAQTELAVLEKEYKNKITENIAIIAVTGEHSERFAEIAATKFKFVTVNYTEAADSTYNNVLVRGGKDCYDTTAHWMVVDELNRIKNRYGILSLPYLTSDFSAFGPECLLRQSIHEIFVKHYNGSLYSAVTKTLVGEKALEKEFSGNLLPVVIYNYVVDLDTNILPKPVATVTAGEDIDEKFVKETLNSVRRAITGQNNETKE